MSSLVALSCDRKPPAGGATPAALHWPTGAVREQVTAVGGGSVGGGAMAQVVVPPGAMLQDAAVSVEARAPELYATLGKVLRSAAWEFRVADQASYSFAQPVTVSVPYEPSLVPAGGEQRLMLSVWSGARWEPVAGSRVDAVEHRVSAQVTHFSLYAATEDDNADGGGNGGAGSGASGPGLLGVHPGGSTGGASGAVGSGGASGANAGPYTGTATQPGAAAKPFLALVQLDPPPANNQEGDPIIGKSIEAKGVFWDQPFALCVPVEQPYDGGKVRMYWVVRERWDTPNSVPPRGSYFTGNRRGIYPADGKPFDAGSARIEDGDILKLDATTQPGGGANYRFIVNNHMGVEKDAKHQPFTDDKGQTRYGEYLGLNPARPGWYVLWWQVCNLSWPPHLREKKEVQVTLLVDTMVSRGEAPGPERLEYLLGRGKKPSSGAFDENSVRIATHEITITFRKDGWAFDKAEARVKEASKKELATSRPVVDDYLKQRMTVTPTVSQGGPSMAMKVTTLLENVRPQGNQQPTVWVPTGKPATEEMSWRVEFPQQFLDDEMADVVVTPDRKVQPDEPDFGHKPMWFGQWKPYVQGQGMADVDCWLPPPTRKNDFDSTLREKGLADSKYYQGVWFDEAANPPKLATPVKFRFVAGTLNSNSFPTEQMQRAFVENRTSSETFVADCGPWEVVATYRRMKDLDRIGGGNGGPSGPVKIVQEKDPYFPWYLQHHLLVQKKLAEIEGYKREALATGTLISFIRRDITIIDASMKHPKVRTPDGEDPLETPTDRALRHVIEAAWDLVPNVSFFDTGQESTPEMDAKKAAKITELRGEIQTRLKEIDETGKKATDAYTEIVNDLDKAGMKYATTHPNVIHWQEDFTHDRERVPLVMAQAAGDRDAMLEALTKMEPLALSADTRALMGQLYLSDGDVVMAITNFRSARDVDPDNKLAEEGLKIAEIAVLRTALSKSQGTVKIARDNFERYMKSRGFRMGWTAPATQPEDPNSIWELPPLKQIYNGAAWWTDLIKYPFRKTDWDSDLSVVGSGITGSISAGFYNRPGHEADLLNTYEEDMAKAFMGLHMMIYLRGKGHSLDEIVGRDPSEKGKVVFGGASTEKIKSWMPAKNMYGQPFSDQDFRNMALAIHNAARLDEVTALLTQDEAGLRVALEKQSYWSKKDIADTWWEWIGDLTSVKNVFTTLLPYAVSTSAPRLSWGYWSARDAAFAARLQATGRAISGTEALARAVGWSRALQALGRTGAGAKLVTLITKYHEHLEMLEKASKLKRYAWSAGTVMGTIMVQSVAAHYAEKWDMPQLNLLVEGFMLFGSDTEMLAKLMQENKLPAKKAAEALSKQVIPALVEEEKNIVSIRKLGLDLTEALDSKAGGKTLASKLPDAGNTLKGLPPSPTPDGSASHDIGHVLIFLNEDLESGVDHGAGEIVKQLEKELQDEEQEIAKLRAKVEEARNKLQQVEELPETEVKPPPGPPTRIDRDPPAGWFFDKLGKLPPAPHPDSKCAKALAALEAEDYGQAIKWFKEAKDDIGVGTAPPDFELPEDLINRYIAIAREAPTAKLPRVTVPEIAEVSLPIAGNTPEEVEKEMERILALPRQQLNFGKNAVQGTKFSVNNGEYFLKEITRDQLAGTFRPPLTTTSELERMAEAELVKALVYDEVGLASGRPGVQVKMHYDADGDLDKIYIVFRGIRGEELNKLSPAQQFLIRKRMAQFRPADLLIGDCDRKPANFMVHGPEARPMSVDAGLADPAGRRLPLYFKKPVDAPVFMEGEYGLDHYYARALPENCPDTYVAESLLTYEDSNPTIQQIERIFLKDKSARAEFEKKLTEKLRRVYPKASEEEFARKVAENMNGMTTRAKRLDQVMQRLNVRQGKRVPGQPASLLPIGPYRFEDYLFINPRDLAAFAPWRKAA